MENKGIHPEDRPAAVMIFLAYAAMAIVMFFISEAMQ